MSHSTSGESRWSLVAGRWSLVAGRWSRRAVAVSLLGASLAAQGVIPNECCPESNAATITQPREQGWEQAPEVQDAGVGLTAVDLYGRAIHDLRMPAVRDGMTGMASYYHAWLALDMSMAYWSGAGTDLVNSGIPVPPVGASLLEDGKRMQPRPGTMPGLYIYEPNPIGGGEYSEPGEPQEGEYEGEFEGALLQYGSPIETGASPASTAIFRHGVSLTPPWPIPSAPVVYSNQLSGAQLWHFGTYLEVRYVDGSVARFEYFNPYSSTQPGKLWRVDWVKDPYDNHAEYSYDQYHRLTSIAFPSQLTQRFEYAPSWGSGWGTDYLLEVSYTQGLGTPTQLTDMSWGLAFQGGAPSSGMHFGGRLVRTYSAVRRVLKDPTSGVPHTISGSAYVTGQVVHGFVYDATSRHVTEKQSVHTGTTFAATITVPTGLADLDVVQTLFGVSAPNRVTRQTNLLTTSWWDLSYSAGTRNTDLLPGVTSLQAVTVTDRIGGKRTFEFDPQAGHVYSVILEPENDFDGRPRANDSTNSGLAGASGDVEPDKIEIYNIFDSTCVCQKPIERQIRSTLGSNVEIRTTTYEYDPTTKLLTKRTESNPETGSGPPVATREWTYTYVQATTSGQVWGAWLPLREVTPDGTWDYTHSAWWNRVDPTQHGRMPGSTTRQMTNVRLAAALDGSTTGTTSVEDIVYRNLPNHPGSITFEPGIQGLPRKVVDGDGVYTVYDYSTEGWLENEYSHSGAVHRMYGLDASGLVTSITDNIGASTGLVAVTTIQSQNAYGVVYESEISGAGPDRTTEYYHDRFGHVAVVRQNNLDSTGSAPSKHGAGSSSARAWIETQHHFLHHQLECTFVDRKPLDEAAGTGQFAKTEYDYLANGRLETVTHPNGSVTNYDFDGFGTLYRTVRSHSGASGVVSSAKSFVNQFLEETGVYQASGSNHLWTLFERNDAGAITKITEPNVTSGVPSGYTGSTGEAYHEFEIDKMGRVVEVRSYAAGGSSLMRKREIRYDQLSRQYWQKDHVLTFGSGSHYTAWRYKANRSTQLDELERSGVGATKYLFFPSGLLEKTTDGSGNFEEYGYHASTTYLASVTRTDLDPGASNRVTSTTYGVNALGQVTLVSEGGVLDHAYAYNSLGRVDRYTDPAGKVQKFLPDALGRVVEHVRLEGSGAYIHNSSAFVDFGQSDGRTLMTRTDGLGQDTVTHYDFAGRPFIVQNPGHSGTAPTSTVPNQSMSLFAEYDEASRITAIHDGDGGKTQYWRDGSGRMIQRAMVKHGALISLWNTKEILNRDGLGRASEIQIFGSLTATGGVPDHALAIATEGFKIDSLDRTHKEEYDFTFAPANTLEIDSSYTGGNPYRSTLDYADNLGSGSTAPLSMDFGHDTIGRLTSIDWTGHSGSTTALADYEWVGGLRRNRFVRYSASSYPEGKTTFGYDAYNRLTQIKDDVYTAGSTFTTKSQFDYEYDLASNLVKEKYAKVGGGLGDRFAYDGYHRLTEAWMGVLDATVMASSSNPSGWVSGQVHSYLTYDLDDANNRSETKVQDAGGTATTDYDLQGGSHPQGPSNRYDAVGPSGGALTPYEYDGRGNLIRDGVFVFRYDYLNRLQEVWKIRVDGDDDTEQYALVQEGADEEARQEVKLEVPDLMQRLPREHMNPTFRARLRAQITGGVIRLRGTGQGGGGMPSFTTPAQADLHAVYAYDAYNRRIMGIVVGVDTQFHTWDGWRQVVQYSLDTAPSPDAAVPTKQFVWGSRLDELLSYRRKNGSTWENYFVLHGGQDAAAKLVNSSGAVVEQYEYDPYGKVSVYVGSSTTAVATSSVGLPFLWKGVRLDSETGLLQMRNRYYSTVLGRFLTRDPLGVWGDGVNLGNGYAYGGNCPLIASDPYGLFTSYDHIRITDEALKDIGLSKDCRNKIKRANTGQDRLLKKDAFHNPANHFDNCSFWDGFERIRLWTMCVGDCGAVCKRCDELYKALADIGKILHALQDFYAHSNWVRHHMAVGKFGADDIPTIKPYTADNRIAFPSWLTSGSYNSPWDSIRTDLKPGDHDLVAYDKPHWPQSKEMYDGKSAYDIAVRLAVDHSRSAAGYLLSLLPKDLLALCCGESKQETVQ